MPLSTERPTPRYLLGRFEELVIRLNDQDSTEADGRALKEHEYQRIRSTILKALALAEAVASLTQE